MPDYQEAKWERNVREISNIGEHHNVAHIGQWLDALVDGRPCLVLIPDRFNSVLIQKSGGQISLRVQVNDHNPLTLAGEHPGEMVDEGGLPTLPLLLNNVSTGEGIAFSIMGIRLIPVTKNADSGDREHP